MTKEELDESYGAPRAALRVDPWEVNRAPKSKTFLDEPAGSALKQYREVSEFTLFVFAAKCVSYLWLIDVRGQFVLAVEELAEMPDGTSITGFPRRRDYPVHPAEEKKLGHPTLVGGSDARIGGELFLDDPDGSLQWFVNVNSGRYCKETPPNAQQEDAILQHFRALVDRDVQFDDIKQV